MYNITDTAYAGGADPSGANDSTAAIQAALDAAAPAGGGLLYIPAGNYRVTSGLTWTSASALRIAGDSAQASYLRMNSSAASFACLTVSNSARFTMSDLSIVNDTDPPAVTDAWIALETSSVGWAAVSRVTVQTGAAANRINQGIVVSNTDRADIDHCDIRASVNPVCITGTSSGVSLRETILEANTGGGVTTTAGILIDGPVGTVHLRGVITASGDYGMLVNGTGADPAFFFLYDVEVNNPDVGGIAMTGGGSQLWASQCWLSNINATAAAAHGWLFGSSYQGTAYLTQCTFQGWSGHSLYIEGGKGFVVTDSTFGQAASGKQAANSYDEIHLGASASNVTISNNHFNVETYYGLSGKNPSRSAVYTESGASAVTLSGSIFAPSGYGTSQVQDLAGAVVESNNIGWRSVSNAMQGAGDTTVFTVTAASFTQASKAWTIPAYDAQAGTVYRLTCSGSGRQGSTQQAFNAAAALFGTSGAMRGFAPSVIAASTTFAWKAVMEVVIKTAGATGVAEVTSTMFISTGTTGTGETSSLSASAVGYQQISVNTTSASSLQLNLQWGSTTGSPTATCDSSIFERIGP